MTSARLLKDVVEAFSGAPMPTAEQLVATASADSENVVEDWAGVEWRQIPLDWLRRRSDAIHVMTQRAVHYYLQAYLTAVVASPDGSSPIALSLLIRLAPPKDSDDEMMAAWKVANSDLFNAPELAALAAVLSWIRTHSCPPELEELEVDSVVAFWRQRANRMSTAD